MSDEKPAEEAAGATGSFTDEHFDPDLVGDGESVAIFPIRRARKGGKG